MKFLFLCVLGVGFLSACGNDPTNFQTNGESADTKNVIVNESSFKAATINTSSIEYQANSITSKIKIPLFKEDTRTLNFSQNTRNTYIQSATQGREPQFFSQTYQLQEEGPLDLLLVVDNSDSMTPYQAEIASRLEPLIGDIGNTDWQIAVVTTDESCLRNFGQPLTKQEYLDDPAGFARKFEAAVSAGATGDNVERGIEMAINGFKGICHGRVNDWTRKASRKAVLLLSDEENCGSESFDGCKDDGNTGNKKPADYIAELGKDVKFYGILYSQSECSDNGHEVQPSQYYDLVQETGGIWEPICQDDYTTTLENISKEVRDQPIRKFELPHNPDTENVTLKIGSQKIDVAIDVEDSVLSIEDDVDSSYTEVVVEYTYGSLEKFDSMKIDRKVDEDTLNVFIDEQPLSNEQYSFDEDSNTVQFNTIPADSTNVAVEYKAIEERLASHRIQPQSYVHSVLVEGKPVPRDNFKIQGNHLVFNAIPEDGQRIEVQYNYFSDYKTEYEVAMPGVNDLTTSILIDEEGGVEIPHDIADGKVIIEPQYIDQFKNAILELETPELEDSFELRFPQIPIEDSIKFSSHRCDSTIFDETTLKVQCDGAHVTNMLIQYSYYTPINNRFELKVDPIDQQVLVFIDGEETKDFEVNQKTVTVDKSLLDPLSEIRVKTIQTIGIN